MTLTIELEPEEAARLEAAARQKGIDTAELARQLLSQHLPAVDEGNAATIALLQSWLDEDATDDPEEIEAAERDLEAFKQSMNAERDRAGARRIFP